MGVSKRRLNPIVYEVFNKNELDYTIEALAAECIALMAKKCASLEPIDSTKDTDELARIVVMEVAQELCNEIISEIQHRYIVIDAEDKKKNETNSS